MILITGGAASGKSRYASERAGALGSKILFVATCVPQDAEMRAKVERHRSERPPGWTTVERERDLAGALGRGFDAAIVDCMTLFTAQALYDQKRAEADILDEARGLALPRPYPVFVVTNEVGSGIVPEHASGRRFREVLGRVNAILAAASSEAVLMVSGLPLTLKAAT